MKHNDFTWLTCDVVACCDKGAWKRERRKRIHATDGAKALANDSLYAVYADKVNPPLVEFEQEWQTIKLAMEGPARVIAQKKYGGKVHAWPEWAIAISREYPWLACTPDGLVESPERPGVGNHQIKCWSEFDRGQFLQQMPLAIQVQTQIEMKVLELQWGVVDVLFGSNSIERFYTEPNPAFVAAMLETLRDLHTCIELRTPPPVDGSAATTRALARLHPDDNGLAVALPEGSDNTIGQLQRCKSLLKRLEARQAALENQIKAAIGGNTYGQTPSGQWVSWKSQSRKEYTVAATTYRTLRECKEPKLIEYANGQAATPAIDYKIAKRKPIAEGVKQRLFTNSPFCRWCNCQLTRATMTIEHVVPLAIGGTNDEHNLALACERCNLARGDNATLPVSMKG